MKFFTKSFYTGRLTEKGFADKVRRYQENISSIRPFLTDELRRFLEEVDVHDALTRRLHINRHQGEINLELRCGDLRTGYYDVQILFKGIKILDRIVNGWRKILDEEDVEILAEEISLTKHDRFGFALIFSSYSDIYFEFENLDFTKKGCEGRKFIRYDDRVLIL